MHSLSVWEGFDLLLHWTYQVSAALEFPADLLSIVGLEWLGRRSKLPFLRMLNLFQVVLGYFHVSRWSNYPALRLADRRSHGSGNLCHGWKILCHLGHEHWLSVFRWGRFTRTSNHRWHLLSQVLPTTLRGQGMAVVHLMSMVSQVASPLIVYSVSNISHSS